MNTADKPRLNLEVNGTPVQLLVDPSATLLEVLREDLGLTGTKHGCELGECGACTVLLSGVPVMACLQLAVECENASIETVEGLAGVDGLHPLQQALAENGGLQCGYCTPAMLLTAKALLAAQPDPGRAAIREALSGNLCRCTGYQQIVEAVETAAARIADTRKVGGDTAP